MKTIILALLMLGFTASTFATDKAELENRVRNLTSKLAALQLKPDKRIPAEYLNKAKGIILLNRTKAGFIFAYQGGSGVAMVKEEKGNKWSPVGFVKADEASLGFLIGGQQSFVVILLMSTNATQALISGKFDFGGEAAGTAGEVSTKAEGNVTDKPGAVLVFTDTKGLYGGAAIKGGGITPADADNFVYYGQSLEMEEILFGKKVERSESAVQLADKINELAKGGPK